MNPIEEMKDQLADLKRRLFLKESYVRVFETPEGQLVLHDIIRRSRLFSSPAGDALSLARQAGRSEFMLEILTMTRMKDEAAMLKLLNARHDNRTEENDRG